jgi:hypothetical protein
MLGNRFKGCLGQQIAMLFQRDHAGFDRVVAQAAIERIEHVQRGAHDLRADTVARDHRNGLAHGETPWIEAGEPARGEGRQAENPSIIADATVVEQPETGWERCISSHGALHQLE